MDTHIRIDKGDLKLLLEKRRDSIVHSASGKVIAADILALLSLCTASFQLFVADSIIFGALMVFAGSIWIAITLSNYIYRKKNALSHEQLFKEIEGIGNNEHPFNLMIIQNKTTNKILTVYDKRWDMWLLPYEKASSSEGGSNADKTETALVREYLNAVLGINNEDAAQCKLSFSEHTRKYSVSDNVFKVYYHRFFKVATSCLPETEEFEICGTRYRWWYFADLEIDPKTQQNNSEIIATVKREVLSL